MEHRVGLTPASVRELCAYGHGVIVEAGAGEGIGMDDEAYRRAGASIVGKAAEVYKRLLRRGVIVRPVGGAYQLPEHLRVTVGTVLENEKFLAALAASLRE